MTIQITDTAELGARWFIRVLDENKKGIERFRGPFPCPIWETRDASLRQMNSSSIDSSILPDSRHFYGCSDARQTEHTPHRECRQKGQAE